MGVMPERIGKGLILRKLDERYADQGRRIIARDRLRSATNANKDVADIGAEADSAGNIVLLQKDKDHIKDHWFNRDNKGWWKANKDVDLILKYGLLTALEEAVQRNKPVKTLWICSGPKGAAPFEVYVYPTDEQVTLIIFSPNLPDDLYDDPTSPNPPQENVWIVKRIRHVDATNGKLDGHKDGDEDLVTLADDIKIVKRKPKLFPDQV